MPETSPAKPSAILMTSLVLSIILGGAAGGVVGLEVTSNRGNTTSGNIAVTTASRVAVQEDSATVDVVKAASPAVVSIVASQDLSKLYQQQQSPFDFFGFPSSQQSPPGQQDVSQGSGYVISADGMIVTNKHVVDNDQATYTVVMNDGKTYSAKVMAKDPTNDIAVVKIDATNLPTLAFGDSNSVGIGQTVIAIGNARGQYRNTVTKGIISGKARTITAGDGAGSSETLEDVFQTDAAINPGNSGGPLLDLNGRVIAMNTAIDQNGQLIGFAIPANLVKKDVDSVQTSGKIVRPYLGVRYVVVTKTLADKNKLPVDHGALVQPGQSQDELAVISGSPADKAGLVSNDIITEINGKTIDADHSLASLLAAYQPGDTITLTIYHDGKQKDVKVKLDQRTQ